MSDLKSYLLYCRRCRYIRDWPEKAAYESDALPTERAAYMCVNPERRNPARVIPEDAPFSPCASEGARTCPMKADGVTLEVKR